MKKKIICILMTASLTASLAAAMSACGTTDQISDTSSELSEAAEVSEISADTETDTETEITESTEESEKTENMEEELSLADYAGVWTLDQEITGEHLSSHDSLEEMFGSTLAEEGAELTITEDESVSYYIGSDFYAEGTCTITGGWILAGLELNREGEADSAQTEKLNQILQPTELSGTEYLAMVLDDETLYWTRTEETSADSSDDLDRAVLTTEEMEALADVTLEVIDGYGYEDDHSELSFLLDGMTLEDCGDYYLVCATLEKPVVVTGDLEIGDSLTFTTNDLTGETATVVYKAEGVLLDEETGVEYYYWPDNDEVTLYNDSDDRVDSPFYEGALRIRKDAITGTAIDENYVTVTQEKLEEETGWYNQVSFEDGYVTGLVFEGD